MATKLFVGNLSYTATEGDLKDAFSQAGEVISVNIVTDKMTGRSRGFAFVEMTSEEDAAKAIEMVNGKDIAGRAVTVNTARPMEDRPRRSNFSNGSRGNNW